jgi:metal-responsive CopG/Arc/MetJ family transcriptional regulator
MKQRVEINFPKKLLEDIEEYRKKESITTRTGAILELIRNALKEDKTHSSRD